MTDDELEARLRDALAARDPGTSAPVSLRERVARVPTSPTGVRSPFAARAARAAGALLATAAAVVVGIVGVSSVRNIGQGASAPPSAASGIPDPTPDLHLAGFVLALPVWLVVGFALAVLFVVTFNLEPTGVSIPRLIAHPPRGFGWIARSVPRRLALFALAILVVAGGLAFSGTTDLVRGSSWSPGTAHYMGELSGYGNDRSTAFFRYEPGTTVGFSQTVANVSSLPITILGGDRTQPWIELRLVPLPTAETIYGLDTGPTFPFAPFELAPHDERQIMFVMHVAPCLGVAPGPSPEPTPNLGSYFTPPPGGGGSSFDSISLRYSVLGLERTAVVEFDPIPYLWTTSDTGCGFDSYWANPSARPPGVP